MRELGERRVGELGRHLLGGGRALQRRDRRALGVVRLDRRLPVGVGRGNEHLLVGHVGIGEVHLQQPWRPRHQADRDHVPLAGQQAGDQGVELLVLDRQLDAEVGGEQVEQLDVVAGRVAVVVEVHLRLELQGHADAQLAALDDLVEHRAGLLIRRRDVAARLGVGGYRQGAAGPRHRHQGGDQSEPSGGAPHVRVPHRVLLHCIAGLVGTVMRRTTSSIAALRRRASRPRARELGRRRRSIRRTMRSIRKTMAM